MIRRLPTIGVVATATNSLSRGYFAFLASMDSWRKVADDIVLVDGGTSDGSNGTLKEWCNGEAWRIIATPSTSWGTAQRWHAAQWTSNTTVGLTHLTTDWAVIVNADYVFDVSAAGSLRRELADSAGEDVVMLTRQKLTPAGRWVETPMPCYAVNLRRLRQRGIRVGFGVAAGADLSDAPLAITEHSAFRDPHNGVVKFIYKGPRLKPSTRITPSCFVYGHYFFSRRQLLEKLVEFDLIYATRYGGHAPLSSPALRQLTRYSGIASRDQELARSHPPEIRRVLDVHHSKEMIGAPMPDHSIEGRVTAAVARFDRRVRSKVLSLRAFEPLNRKHEWSALDQDVRIVEVLNSYQQQDRLLPYRHRLDSAAGMN